MDTCLSQEIVYKVDSLMPKPERTRRAIKQHQKLFEMAHIVTTLKNVSYCYKVIRLILKEQNLEFG